MRWKCQTWKMADLCGLEYEYWKMQDLQDRRHGYISTQELLSKTLPQSVSK